MEVYQIDGHKFNVLRFVEYLRVRYGETEIRAKVPYFSGSASRGFVYTVVPGLIEKTRPGRFILTVERIL